MSQSIYMFCDIWVLTDYCLLELATIIQLKQLSRSESEYHALIIFLEMVINLCGD